MRALTGIAVCLALSAGLPVRTANAQTPAPPPGRSPSPANRFRVSVNAVGQWPSISFTGSTTTVIYLEKAIVNTTYDVPSGPAFDGGVLVRLAGGFHVGVAVSSFMNREDAEIAATIPHPFFLNTPRSISGTAENLERRELVTHLEFAYVTSPGKLDIAISAGPSWFHVDQEMVTDVRYTEGYPYDTVTFASASTATVAANSVGFNAGVDVGVRLSKHVGVGGLVRFSGATVELPLPGAATTVKSDTGGLQAGGGLRLYF